MICNIIPKYAIVSKLLILALIVLSCKEKQIKRSSSWPHYAGSASQSRYFESFEINKENVAQMKVHWMYPTQDNLSYYINPIIVDSIMYVMAKNHSLIALNIKTKQEIWIHTDLRKISRRGFHYWSNTDGTDKRILFTLGNSLQAIDSITGKSIKNFGENGYVDLRKHLGRDPSAIRRVQSQFPGVIYKDIIILGSSPGEGYFSPPGYVRAYNISTGKLIWVFHTIPRPGEFGYDTWPKDAYKYVGGTNVWSEMSVDIERGIVFLPIGSPTYDFYGADRKGSNLFGNSLVALDAKTGERLWHFQTVHHDLWDYDLSSSPQLITINRHGKEIDAVAVATKQGLVFVFDRETGEPVFPIEERAFPSSTMSEEETWPTQPIPSLPGFTRNEVTKETLNPYFSDSIKQWWYDRLDAAKTGLYIPPSDQYETIVMPGSTGGANFGNTAANPLSGTMYIMSQEYAGIYQLEKVEKLKLEMTTDEVSRVQNIYSNNCQVCHGSNTEGGAAPALKNLGQRLYFFQFEDIIKNGRGRMPAFVHLDDGVLKQLYLYLGGNPSRLNHRFQGFVNESNPVIGPVVDSGGIEMLPDKTYVAALSEYPDDVSPPQHRYTTDYGSEWPALMTPPWSFLVAYNLSEGKIKWKQPIGLDSLYARGDKNLGAPGGIARKGMVITSSGIVFGTAKGGQLFALDADTGGVLWETTLSHESNAQPSMYSIDGKDYLVVNATSDFDHSSYDFSKKPEALDKGYVVYALPD